VSSVLCYTGVFRVRRRDENSIISDDLLSWWWINNQPNLKNYQANFNMGYMKIIDNMCRTSSWCKRTDWNQFGPTPSMLWGWKGKFRNFSMMILPRNTVTQPISSGFGQWNIWITSPWSKFFNADLLVWIGQSVVELLQFLQQTSEIDEIVYKGWSQELLYLHQYQSNFDGKILGTYLEKIYFHAETAV
jgi:hypothetical protein